VIAAVAAVLLAAASADARAISRRPPRPPKPKVTSDTVAGGKHWRFKADKGVVHVWIPEGYDARAAGTVVYVHGYYTSADEAWSGFHLADQFRASKQNAVFIVPDAPRGNDDGLYYDTLTNLLRQVWRHTHLERPWGPIVVIGHSGAFRTIVPWLDYTAIDHVILLDALYADENKFAHWLTGAKGHESNKLTVVGEDTTSRAEAFLRQFKGVVRMKKIPGNWDQLDKRQRTARVLYMQSQYGHMQLVSNGKVIPLLLRRTPLRPIGVRVEVALKPVVIEGGVDWSDPHPFGK
jgi:hypothetical protein